MRGILEFLSAESIQYENQPYNGHKKNSYIFSKKEIFPTDQNSVSLKTTNAELIYSYAIKTKNFFGKTHCVIQRHSHTTCVHT